jgi:adenine-specific DNA-methyltransferase
VILLFFIIHEITHAKDCAYDTVVDYIGSKLKLNPWIFSTIEKYIHKNDWQNCWFLDGCSGTGAVAKFAIDNRFKVIANDILLFPSVIIKGYHGMSIKMLSQVEQHITNINNISGRQGFFYHNYSEQAGRLYFTDENAKLLDATRTYIAHIVNRRIRDYMLYLSLEGMSKMLNATGIQSTFLKKIKKTALRRFQVTLQPFHTAEDVHVFTDDLRVLLENNTLDEDILYLDPPYNNRQYGSYYHLYETFVRYDAPKITGKGGLRDWKAESKSDFCSKKTCLSMLEDIISRTKAKLIVISYSTDGMIKEEEITGMLEAKCESEIAVFRQPQKRYKADNNRENNKSALSELLFVLER